MRHRRQAHWRRLPRSPRMSNNSLCNRQCARPWRRCVRRPFDAPLLNATSRATDLVAGEALPSRREGRAPPGHGDGHGRRRSAPHAGTPGNVGPASICLAPRSADSQSSRFPVRQVAARTAPRTRATDPISDSPMVGRFSPRAGTDSPPVMPENSCVSQNALSDRRVTVHSGPLCQGSCRFELEAARAT
jgi:hypothetical protein